MVFPLLSPMPVLAVALLPPVLEPDMLPPVLDPDMLPPVLELAAPVVPAVLEPIPLPPFDIPPVVPGVVGVGLAAPISPAAVPGPARPALSVSAGDPAAAYAPATATDMQPATNANMSFLITTSR